MLEDRSFESYLVSSRVFTSSFLQNAKRLYMYSHGKRCLEIDATDLRDDLRFKRSCKLSDFSANQENQQSDSGNDLNRFGEEQSDSNGTIDSLNLSDKGPSDSSDGDSSGSDSLFSKIGSDNSIDCLIRCSRSDYGSIASLNKSFRALIRTGEIYKLRRQNGFVEHWVYFSCDRSQWDAFDPISRKWMRLPLLSLLDECFVHSDKESLAVGTDLLVFGRDMNSHVMCRYSLLTNSWSLGVNMSFPRCLFASASLGEIAILAGGFNSNREIFDCAEMYNAKDKTWTTLPRMNKRRKMCSGVFMDKKFYVIGGIGGNDSRVLTCGEEYDLETKKWTEIPNMSPSQPSGGGAPPLVAVVNDELYAADHADMEVKKYDKKRRMWFTVGRLPERADSMNGWGLAFRACGDRLIVIGGPRNDAGGGFIELNSWVPNAGGPPQWESLAIRPSNNFVYNCAVMGC